MNVSLGNVSRGIHPPFAAGGAEPPAAKPAEGWKTREAGAAELTKVAGEEAVDETVLRRDDDLGGLMSRAFDPANAAAALPKLFE